MPEELLSNYEDVTVPLNFKSGSDNHVTIKACNECGAFVFDIYKHRRWHGYGKVTFTNA